MCSFDQGTIVMASHLDSGIGAGNVRSRCSDVFFFSRLLKEALGEINTSLWNTPQHRFGRVDGRETYVLCQEMSDNVVMGCDR